MQLHRKNNDIANQKQCYFKQMNKGQEMEETT